MSQREDKSKRDSQAVSRAVRKVAIVGLPNTGKSQVFNNLTGEYALVANYPLTTVEMKRTRCRINGDDNEVIDTPGLHCLYIHSEEELVVRDMIFAEKPDVIIQCVDANQLKQSLTLTADLLELGVPMVISLNAIDETARKGLWIDSRGLSRVLGVPVIESIAINGVGTEELKQAIKGARRGKCLQYGQVVDEGVLAVEAELPENASFRRKMAVLMLAGDPFLPDHLADEYGPEAVTRLKNRVTTVRRRYRGHFGLALNDKRSHWVDEVAQNATHKQVITPGEFSITFGRLSRHPVFGLPILSMFLLVTYLLVVHGAGLVQKVLEAGIREPVIGYVSSHLAPGFWKDLCVGQYGVLTLGFFNAICTVLPILVAFFLMFGLLEDTGYIPNLCVLTKRVLEKVGLTGKAIMPLVLGFGCKTMATLVAGSLRSRKEKFIAVYLIAFAVPCSAQLAIGMGILGRMGFGAFLIGYGTLGIVALAVGVGLDRLMPGERASDFLQELPLIRIPNLKAVLIKTCYRLYWFLKEALPLFIVASIALFALDKTGVLAVAKKALSPVIVGWLDLPVDIVDAFIVSLARHETAAVLLLKMVDTGSLDYRQCIVAVITVTTFFPCLANVVAMCKEMGAKTALAMVVAISLSSVAIGGILNLVLIGVLGR